MPIRHQRRASAPAPRPPLAAAGGGFDAVFVGSGINGLVGAALLARRGWRVAVLEREERLGGALRTVTTAGGFETELMSCFHVQFLASPAYRALRDDLVRHGLRFANTGKPLAVVTDAGESLVLTTDRARNVAALERVRPGEGRAWDAAVGSFFAEADDLLGIRGVYPVSRAGGRWLWRLWRRRGTAGTMKLVSDLLTSARTWLTGTFDAPLTHALLAPWSLHGAAGPDEPGSGVVVRLIGAFSEAMGSPVAVGGGKAIVAALVAIIEEHGGVCATGVDVERIDVERGKARGVLTSSHGAIRAKRAVVCSVTPAQLYHRLLAEVAVPDEVRAHASAVRPGLAAFQLALSLDRPLRWAVEDDLSDVGVVNLTGGMDAVSRAANEGRRGLLPAEPTLCCGQPMALDPTRGPDGGSQLWVQVLDVPPVPVGDAAGEIPIAAGWTTDVRETFADRVQARLAAHLPGLAERLVERIALSPADLEAANVNLVGGSPNSGSPDLDQMAMLRPSPYAPAPRTPVAGLYHIGASTHPGAGVSGASGFLTADLLLRGRLAARRAA